MKFIVTYIEQYMHTVPVEANSYEEAETVADHLVTRYPHSFCRDSADWHLHSVQKQNDCSECLDSAY